MARRGGGGVAAAFVGGEVRVVAVVAVFVPLTFAVRKTTAYRRWGILVGSIVIGVLATAAALAGVHPDAVFITTWARQDSEAENIRVNAINPGLILTPRVDRSGLVTVRMVKYSVPAHLIGRRVRVSLRATEVVVFEGRSVAAVHPRVVARGTSHVTLDHYLGGAAVQTRRPARVDRLGPGPCSRRVYAGT